MSVQWSVEGDYMEACSCDYLCPCILENATTPATHDFCKVAMTYGVRQGRFGNVDLAGVSFAVVAQSKAVMSQGEWILGVIVDDRATDAQAEAIAAIASGSAGGPLAHFAPLVGEFRGLARARIDFTRNGHHHAVSIDGQLVQEVEGVESVTNPGQCLAIDNVAHPAATRLSLAKALRNVIRCFGIEWEGKPGGNNGHFAPFSWSGASA